MQILRTYGKVNPRVIFSEIEDLIKRYGGTVDKDKTYKELMPGIDGGLRASLVATFPVEVTKSRPIIGRCKRTVQKEALNARILGEANGETKLMIFIDEESIPAGKAKAMEADLDFIIKSYEK